MVLLTTISSVPMDNACRDSLSIYASTDKRVNSCLPISMQGVLAFSMSYITIHAKLVLLLMHPTMIIGMRSRAYHD